AAGLHGHQSVPGALAFAGLFVPVSWTWTTYAYAADLFDADDGAFRAVLLGAMLMVAALAATIPAAFAGRTGGFVIVYAILRADLLIVYAWARRSDRSLRGLAGQHLGMLGLGGIVWLSSLAVAAPARYLVWAVSIAIDLATGLVAYFRSGEVPSQRSHMPERFALFTLIVLGESIVAVSLGTARSSWAPASVATAGLGFVLAALLWWMYFARFDDTVFDWALAGSAGERGRSLVFGYAHLPVFAALAAVGVGVRVAIEQSVAHGPATRAAPLLALAVAVYLAALTMIQRAAPQRLPVTVAAGRTIVTAALLVLAFLGRGLDALVLVALATLAVLAQVIAEGRAPAA
ncbi:MAG: low temperature requirement protein A, partial [Pseudonocardia sp.]|nr:low temperature requirement protein A [Pseudonocardia sp.]